MHGTLRPWITAGVALTGAGMIAATPVVPSLPGVQHRSIQLTDQGVFPYPEEDLTQLLDNTTANWQGLEEMANGITYLWNLPMDVWNTALPQIDSDSMAQLEQLLTQGYVTDSFSDAVLNPVSEATLPVQILLSLPLAFNAFFAGGMAVIGNTMPYWPEVPTQFEAAYDQIAAVVPNELLDDYNQALSEFGTIGTALGGDFTNAFSEIGTEAGDIGTQLVNLLGGLIGGQSVTSELTALQTDVANIVPASELTTLGNDFGNIVPTSELTTLANDVGNAINTDAPAIVSLWDYISLAPTTMANDFLNGYPVQAEGTDPILSSDPGVTVGNAYTLNAPFGPADNFTIAPEFGLLTNPDAPTTVDVGVDGTATSYLGTVPLETGGLAGLLQVENTLDDELTTVASTVSGSGVTAPPTIELAPVEGPGNFSLEFYLENILDKIFFQSPGTNPGFDTTLIPGFNFSIPKVDPTIPSFDIHIPKITVDGFGFQGFDEKFGGESLELFPGFDFGLKTISFGFHIFSTTCNDSACLDLHLPTESTATVDLGSIGGESGIPAYTNDLTGNDLAILSSIGAITAPQSGSIDSVDIGNFLDSNPVMNLTGVFDTFIQDILGSTLGINIDLPLNWTNLLGVTLNDIFTGLTGIGGLGSIETAFSDVINDFSTFGDDIVNVATEGIDGVETGFNDLAHYINEIPGLFTTGIDDLVHEFDSIGGDISSGIKSGEQAIEHYFNVVVSGLETAYKDTIAGLETAYKDTISTLEAGYKAVISGLNSTISGLESAYHTVVSEFNTAEGDISHYISEIGSLQGDINHYLGEIASLEDEIAHLGGATDEISHLGGIL